MSQFMPAGGGESVLGLQGAFEEAADRAATLYRETEIRRAIERRYEIRREILERFDPNMGAAEAIDAAVEVAAARESELARDRDFYQQRYVRATEAMTPALGEDVTDEVGHGLVSDVTVLVQRYLAAAARESELRARLDESQRAHKIAQDAELELAQDIEDIRAAHGEKIAALQAELDKPCGECHPCTNWPGETLRERDALQARIAAAIAILTEFARHFSGDGVTRAIAVLDGREGNE